MQIRQTHYGGEDNPYEAIKVITAWNAGFNLGNAIKYICRVCFTLKYLGQTNSPETKKKILEDLMKARTYLDFEIERVDNI